MPAAFPLRLAFAWTGFVTGALWLGLSLVFAVFGPSAQDILLPGLTQVVVYAVVLSAFRFALGENVRDLLALRAAPVELCLTAVVLGAALQVPATLLSNGVEHFFPLPDAVLAQRMARITPHSRAHALAILAIVAGLGPCVEEFFFRGALFGALRRGHGALVTNAVVAACFALGHLDLRLLVPLFLAGWVIGEVREQSASIWPALALHAAFNAVTLALVFSGGAPAGKPPAIPALVALSGSALTVALLVRIRRLARASRPVSVTHLARR
jgi:membrane protease YdiL (CAAX protease family)